MSAAPDSTPSRPASAGDPSVPLHAPEVGWVKRLLGDFHVTGVFWYRFHRWGVSHVPSRGGVATIITIFTSFFFVFLFRIRRAIADNLEVVLGPTGWLGRQLRIWRTMWTFAWCLSERYERLSTDRSFEFRVENRPAWDEVASTGGGFVMVSAHVGNYEVGSMLPSARERRKVHLVREREMDPAAQRFVEGLLADLPEGDLYAWHFEGDEPLHALPLLHALQDGDIVAVHGDRPRTGTRVVEGRIFDRPFPIPAGPLTLARTADVPILPAFVLREGRRRYRLAFRPPIRVARSRDRARDLEQAGAEIARAVEWAIRSEPHQWFCFRSVWPHQR